MSILQKILEVAGYLFVAGLCGRLFYGVRTKKCRDRCGDDHVLPALLMGAFWPVAAFPLAGFLAGAWISDIDKRAELRAEREEEQRAHEAELQRREAREARVAMAWLEKQGVKATVVGLED